MKLSLKTISFLVLCLFVLSACQHTPGEKSDHNFHSKKVTVAGSTTILPISETWASAIGSKTNLIVSVQGGGSTSGINLVKKGEVNIGASSRKLSKKEKEGLQLIELGRDALVVVVHPSNTVNNISVENLRAVFTGKIKNWKQLGGKDRPIQVINRESGSGTRSTFEELVMCEEINCAEMLLTSLVLNSNSEVKRSINSVPDAIGYISWGFVDKNVHALNLNGVEPTAENIKNNTYPLFRSLFYLVKSDVFSKEIDQYLDFVLSPEGQDLLPGEGFLPIARK